MKRLNSAESRPRSSVAPSRRILRGVALALALAAGVGAAPSCMALDPHKALSQYSHEAWGEEEGLPQSSIQAVVQSRDGYIWLATQEGLVRFDGKRFVVYDRRNVPLMKSNNVLCLCEDRQGGLWMGLESGGALRLKEGRFTALTTRDGLSAQRVLCLLEDRDGGLWLGTEGGGVCLYKNGRVETFSLAQGLPGRVVYTLAQDLTGRIWVGTNRGVVCRLGGRFEPVALPAEGRNWYYAIRPGAGGDVWIGSFKGLYLWRDGRVTHFATKDGLCDDSIQCLYYEAPTDSLWIGTVGGLNRLRGGRIERYTSRDGLTNPSVTSLAEDREGSLWIGTMGGLNRLRDAKFFTIGTRQGLPSETVVCVCQAPDGSLWVGTDGGGAVRIDDGTAQLVGPAQGLPGKTVNSILAEPDGSVWLAVDSAGLARWKDGKVARAFPNQVQLVNTTLLCMLEDGRGTLWVGASTGLFRIRGSEVTLLTEKDGLSAHAVDAIAEDGAGGLWLGTDGGGLDHYSGGRFTAYRVRDGLADDIVNALYRDADGVLWIGTSGGLSRMEGGRFTSFTTRDGLFDDTVYTILEDAAGYLWMSCNKGVFRVDKRELTPGARKEGARLKCDSYGRADGMGSSECNGGTQPCAWHAGDGLLYFATMKGLAVIDPAAIRLNLQPPPVVIEALLVDGRAVELGPSLSLPPGRHRLEFRYSALSLVAPEKVRFRCRLAGFDSEWTDEGVRREAVYTGLPPGDYTFTVIACNNDGVWNDKGASLTFRQLPSLYQTWWFLLLCAAAAGLVAFGIYRLRLRSLHARQRELERVVEEKTARLAQANDALTERGLELESANRRLHQLTQEDVLTGIANRRRFKEVLDLEWRRGCRTAAPLALIMADIDFFKPYNDSYGHQMGDVCLQKVSRALAGGLNRAGDLLARYGGEEFVVILPGQELAVASGVAEILRRRVEALAIPTGVSAVATHVTVSFGVAAAVPREGESPNVLLEAADRALYAAKHQGRNRVCTADGGHEG